MTSIDTAIAAPPSYRWARVSLVLIAAIELLDALSSMQGIFTEYHHETALLRFAQGINSIKLALSPLLAGAALVLAARGNLRYAIFALAVLTLAGWLLDSLPTIVIHGFKPSLDFGGIEEFVFYLIMPVIAAAAILLAAKRQRLGLAEGGRELACNYQHRHRPTIGGSTRHETDFRKMIYGCVIDADRRVIWIKSELDLDKIRVGLKISARGIPHARLDVHVGPGGAHTLFRGLPGPFSSFVGWAGQLLH